jgi:hypothetical protein
VNFDTSIKDEKGFVVHNEDESNVAMEDNVHMLLEGTITELVIKLEPSLYRIHIWYNRKRNPILYVQL